MKPPFNNLQVKKIFINVITGVAITFSIIMAVRRCFYGIEITDEAYYVAEAVSILRGNIPLTFLMFDKPFFPILLAGCIKLYQLFTPDLSGVFLFSRIMFLIFRFCIAVLIYILLRAKFNRNYLIWSLCFLFTIWGHSIPNLSYNTISCWLIILAGAVIFISLSIKESRKSFLLSGITGILLSLAVLAHPGQALNAVWFGIIYLLFGEKEKRWNKFLIYVCSGIGIFFIILCCFSLQYGWNKFIYGIETIFAYQNRTKAYDYLTNLKSIYDNFKWIFFVFERVLLITLFYKVICAKYLKLPQINFNDATLISVVLCILKLLLYYNEPSTNLFKVGAIGSVFVLVCGIIAIANKDRQARIIVAVFMVFPVTYVIVCGFGMRLQAYNRFWMFDFVFWGGLLLYEKYYFYGNALRKGLCLLTFVSIFFVITSSEWKYFYGEGTLSELNTAVTEGVYRGIYTSESKAKDTQALEKYIQKVTSKEDRVLFLDNVPAGYMMSDGMPWTPSTWDLAVYSLGFDNPIIYYRYFENREKLPTKVIYVDYGRNEKLSIDDVNYSFNDFMNANYYYVESKTFGNTYKVKLYENRNR